MNAERLIETDPTTVDDPLERARIVFAQWHVDDVTGPDEALQYADRLIERLHDEQLTISQSGD